MTSLTFTPHSLALAREQGFVQRENEKLKDLTENIKKCSSMCLSLLDIVDSMETKLTGLESAMLPIQKSTDSLSVSHRNLDIVVKELDRIGPFLTLAMATETGDFDNSNKTTNEQLSPLSPSSPSHISSNTAAFIAWLNDLSEAITCFQTYNELKFSERALKRMKEWNRRAITECAREWERLLSNSLRPYDLSKVPWPLHVDTHKLIPSATTESLRMIFQAILASPSFANTSHSSLTLTLNPSLVLNNTPQTPAECVHLLVAQRSAALRMSIKKAIKDDVNPLWDHINGTPSPAATPRSNVLSSVSMPDSYQKGSHPIIFYFVFLRFLLASEHALLVTLFQRTPYSFESSTSDSPFTKVFGDIAKEPLTYALRKCEERLKDKTRNRWDVRFIELLDIYEHFAPISQAIRSLCKHEDHNNMLIHFQTFLAQQIRKSMDEYRSYIIDWEEEKRKDDRDAKSAPAAMMNMMKSTIDLHAFTKPKKIKTGSVYALTIEVLFLLRRTHDYQSTLESLNKSIILDGLTEVEKERERTREKKREEDRKKKDNLVKGSVEYVRYQKEVAEMNDRTAIRKEREKDVDGSVFLTFVLMCLNALETNMENKSKSYKLPALSALFLLNNCNHIVKFFRKSSITIPSSFFDHYNAIIQYSQKSYRTTTWDRIVSLLPSSVETQRLVGLIPSTDDEQSKKAKKKVKNILGGFNTQFEEIYSAQRTYCVPDPDLRSLLRSDNVECVLSRYRDVYNTILECKVEWSSKMSQYLKYSPVVLEVMLNQFFDEE